MHLLSTRAARVLLVTIVVCSISACGDDDDAAQDAAVADAGAPDARTLDAGREDTGPEPTDAGPDDASSARTVRVLAINDFHGAIAPDDFRPGVGALAATIAMLRASVTESIVVSAGDLIGGSPLESGYWHDEPTIETMNALGLELNAVGDHELDEGPAELLRLLEGGRCHSDGCGPFGMHEGATFETLAANTFTGAIGGETLLPPFVIRELAGVRIAFVGLTLERTRSISVGAASLTFGDEADTVNALVPELLRMGAETIVVLVHEGGGQAGGPSACIAMSGAIVGIVERMDPEIDLVVTGHTHQSYVCEIDGRLVTSAGANGNLVTAIDLVLDDEGDLASATATNVEVPRDMAPEAIVNDIVDEWVDATRTIRERVVGHITASLLRGTPELCHFVADSMLEEGLVLEPRADAALMNTGGIRAGLVYAAGSGGTDGEITFGQIYGVHPFGNRLAVVALTGADVIAALDEGVEPLCPSATLRFTWNGATGATEPGSVLIDGVAVEPTKTYHLVINDFNFAGGEGYTVFGERTLETTTGALLIEAMEHYLGAHDPFTGDPVPRIVFTP